MTTPDPYFPTFVGELHGYIAELHEQESIIASPTRSGGSMDDALRTLRRLGHTIASLGATVGLEDFVLLGDCLEAVLVQMLAGQYPLPRLIGVPLTYLTVHLETRVSAMASAGHYLAPDAGEVAEAERVTSMLRALVPDFTALAVSEDAQATQPDLATIAEEEAAAEEPEERFSADIQNIIDAFLQSELSRSDITFLQSPVPLAAPEALQLFTEEMSDDLRELRRILAELAPNATQPAQLTAMNELAHKLKGAAYVVGTQSIGAVCDMLETMLATLRQGQARLDAPTQRWLIQTLENLDQLRDRLLETGTDEGDTAPLAQLHEGYARIMSDAAAASNPSRINPARLNGHAPTSNAIPTPTQSLSLSPSTMRIDVRRLDQLMSTLGTMHINHIEIDRLRQEGVGSEREIALAITRLTDLYDRLRAERVAAAGRGLSPTLDPVALSGGPRRTPLPPALAQWIEQRRQQDDQPSDDQPELDYYSEFDLIMAMIGETISDLRSMHLQLQTALNQMQRQHEYHDFLAEAVQRDVLALRLVPLGDLLPRLQLAVRLVAPEEGKEVEFEATGAHIEIDGEIANILLEPLVQIVRNAVVHGIETPEERAAAGKTEPPCIRFSAAYAGDGVRIEISDNGRGINHQQLIAKAMVIPSGNGTLLTAERARALSREDAFELMFLPDVSTAVEIRPMAGRGMGLPTVKHAIESVRGTVRASSEPEVGTSFVITIPTTLGTLRGLTVRADINGYVVPLGDVRRTAPIDASMFFTNAEGLPRARVPDMLGQAQEMPVMTLAALLGHDEIPTAGQMALIVLVERVEYAIIVDAIGEERDLIIRRVPKHLRRRGVRGASITTQGEVLLILDLPEMIRSAISTGRLGTEVPRLSIPPPKAQQGDYILVVDDSPSIRHGLELMLREAGHAVETARDGIDAIDHITRLHPRLIILDVEMPQMNGYQLLEVLHSHAPFKHLRAIMLTSRTAAKYRDHALALGAVDYLVKPVSSETLLAVIQRAMGV